MIAVAGRVSGDSTVAYAWAYAMAAEGAAFVTPPERACWLRALLLEDWQRIPALGMIQMSAERIKQRGERLAAKGIDVREIEEITPSMEDVFVARVEEEERRT